jgi:hypothetical protein
MFRRRALQELTDIVATAPEAPEVDTEDPKVMTVQRIQDLLQEVGVDPGEDPVEAARSFLASVDNKLPSSFGSFRLGKPKPAPDRTDEPEAQWGRGKAEPVAPPEFGGAPPDFDAAAFAASGFEPGAFDAAPVETSPSTPITPLVMDDGDAPAPWEQPPRPASSQPSLPDWIQAPGAARLQAQAAPSDAFEETSIVEEPAPVADSAVAPLSEETPPWATAEPIPAASVFTEPEAVEPVFEDSPPVSVGSEELSSANARIEELQAAVMERAAQRDAIRDELEVAEGRLRQLESNLAERDRERDELSARVAELEEASAQANEQISESQQALIEAQHATERAVLEAADITSFEFKGELAPTFEELATAITALESTLAVRERQQAEARTLISQHVVNIAELTAQRNDAFAAIGEARAREQQLNEELAQLRDETASAADDALSADARRSELARLKAELDRAEASLRTTITNHTSANDELKRRRSELGDVQQEIVAVREALRVVTTECEATERRLALARTQTAEAEAARDGARAEAERVIELAMRQAQALRADAERQSEAARILHDAANEAITLQTDAQRQADVVRERAAQAVDAIRVEQEAAAQEREPVAPAILSALITRVASIESHLSQYRDQASPDGRSDEAEATASAE